MREDDNDMQEQSHDIHNTDNIVATAGVVVVESAHLNPRPHKTQSYV